MTKFEHEALMALVENFKTTARVLASVGADIAADVWKMAAIQLEGTLNNLGEQEDVPF